jgi:hypothetical protein
MTDKAKTQKKIKKKNKDGRGADVRAFIEFGATTAYDEVLDTLRPVAGALVTELAARQERRSQHLFSVTTHFPVFLESLSQLHEAFMWLADQPGVDGEVAHLLREAGSRVVSGTEFLLSQPDPRVLDEARYLMEVEFLFLDFSRDPGRLRAWSLMPQSERNRRFDFNALRQLHQVAAGIPPDRVLFDQEEYQLHSSAIHPRPVDRDPPLPVPDTATGLFLDAADLLHHAVRAWTAALAVAGATGSSDTATLGAQRPSLDAVDVAMELIDETQRSIGLLELTGGPMDRSIL